MLLNIEYNLNDIFLEQKCKIKLNLNLLASLPRYFFVTSISASHKPPQTQNFNIIKNDENAKMNRKRESPKTASTMIYEQQSIVLKVLQAWKEKTEIRGAIFYPRTWLPMISSSILFCYFLLICSESFL